MKNRIVQTSRQTWNHSKAKPRGVSQEFRDRWSDLRDRLTADLTARFRGVLGAEAIRQVVNEADSLAAVTQFPILFLPVLAEEKVRAATEWRAKQEEIYNRSISLAA